MNKLKTFKTVICILLGIYLLSSTIYLYFPDLYASILTGYSIDSIVDYRSGEMDSAIICKQFFPEKVALAISAVVLISVILTIVLSVLIIIYRKVLISGGLYSSQSKNTILYFVILLIIAYTMAFAAFIYEYEYDYVVGCAQFHENGEYL